jgi:hypothetical protein
VCGSGWSARCDFPGVFRVVACGRGHSQARVAAHTVLAPSARKGSLQRERRVKTQTRALLGVSFSFLVLEVDSYFALREMSIGNVYSYVNFSSLATPKFREQQQRGRASKPLQSWVAVKETT